VIGQSIAHYKVTAKLGAGGMGEVYRATDSKLGRDVALKVLPEAFAQDAQRMARFQREAQVLASLNHPNIAAIYGLEEGAGSGEQGAAGQTRALVMELVEGPTLAERMAAGAIPLDEALPLAKQFAEALEYAHEHGIVHRDLKPQNIKLTNDGIAKVLDFGLAKAFADEVSHPDAATSPTLSIAATRAGLILGTAGYMSPEQAKGKSADRRADIWSFGVVLCEMLTGQRLYDAETASEILAAVLMKDPDLSALPADTPPRIRELLARCLTKDPKQRLQSIGEARICIERAILHPETTPSGVTSTSGAIRPGSPGWSRTLPWAVAGLLALALGASLWRATGRESGADQSQVRFTVSLKSGHGLDLATTPTVAISPDGTKLVYTARQDGVSRLFLRSIDQLDVQAIAGTEDAAAPFFSPDGAWVAFFANSKLKKVPLAGGPVVNLASFGGDSRGGTWAGETIVYSPDALGGLLRVSANGGQPEPLTKLDAARKERTHRFPHFLPDGKTVLFTVGTDNSPDYYDNSRIDSVRLDTGERKTLFEGASTAMVLPAGHLVYARSGALFSAPFDASRLTVTGPGVAILEGVSGDVTTGAVHFCVSPSGALVYVSGSQSSGDTLARMDRTGKIEVLPAPKRTFLELSLSPDGRRAAITIGAISEYDIWVYEFARGTLSRLTFGGVNRTPKWTADGKRVVYVTIDAVNGNALYSKAADGSGQPELLRKLDRSDLAGGSRAFLDDVSPDGKWISIETGSTANILLFPAGGQGKGIRLNRGDFGEGSAAFSPDGRWIAYQSNESGRPEVYVRAMSETGGKWQVSTTGGESPRWSRTGRELFYHVGNRMMAVPVQMAPTFVAGTPQTLFDNYFDLRTDAGAVFDVAPDGKWFIAVRPSSEQAAIGEVSVVLNWSEELKRRASVKR